MVKVRDSILFWLLCEVLFMVPGGLLDIYLTSTFSTLDETVINLIVFPFSCAILLLCLRIFFYDIFLKIKSLMQIDARKIAWLFASFIGMGLLYFLPVFVGFKLNLVVHKAPLIESAGVLYIMLVLLQDFVCATVEEIVFRGAILSFFLARVKPWFAILFISVFFSLGHVQYIGIMPYLTAFMLGMLLSIVVIKTNTLYVAIGLHTGWNFAFNFYDLYFDSSIKTIPHWGHTFEILQIGTMILLVFLALWYFSRKRSSSKTNEISS